MEIYRIAFIGHREIYGQYDLEDRIESLIKEKLREKEYVDFYVGRNGDFDIFAASAVKRAQKSFGKHNSTLTLVQPYRMKDDVYYERFYDAIEYPISSATHPKAAITKRNQWMMNHSNLLIAYVESDRCGGAMAALKYAEQRGLLTVNLSKK